MITFIDWLKDFENLTSQKIATIDELIGIQKTYGFFSAAKKCEDWRNLFNSAIISEFDVNCLKESYESNVWDYQSNS